MLTSMITKTHPIAFLVGGKSLTPLFRAVPLSLWLAIMLLLAACSSVPQSGECDAHIVYSQEPKNSVLLHIYPTNCPFLADVTVQPTSTQGSATAVPTSLPTVTSTPVPTVTAVPTITPLPTSAAENNLFDNAGFEDIYLTYEFNNALVSRLKLPEIAVSRGWSPAFEDFPYQASPSLALFQGTKNPNGLRMGRPEYRETLVPNRVRSGLRAQYWFCQFRACSGGIYQVIDTVPGQLCVVSAYVQSWSNPEWKNSLGDANFLSQFPNGDARSNSLWRIMVDPSGNTTNLFNTTLKSYWQGLSETILEINGETIQPKNHYDRYTKISYTFIATSTKATVFFRNLRLFPFTFNDSMVDDASAVCQ